MESGMDAQNASQAKLAQNYGAGQINQRSALSGPQEPSPVTAGEYLQGANERLVNGLDRLDALLDRLRGPAPAVAGSVGCEPARMIPMMDHLERQSTLVARLHDRLSQIERYI